MDFFQYYLSLGSGPFGATVFHYLRTEAEFRTVHELFKTTDCSGYRQGS